VSKPRCRRPRCAFHRFLILALIVVRVRHHPRACRRKVRWVFAEDDVLHVRRAGLIADAVRAMTVAMQIGLGHSGASSSAVRRAHW
jgi:tRNA(Phe) wybutosine-synthesizing methylase Tyw3